MFSSSWQARLSRSLSTDMGFNIGFWSSSHYCGQLNIHVNSIVVLLNLDLLPYIIKIGHCRLKGRGLGICYSTFPPVPLWETYYRHLYTSAWAIGPGTYFATDRPLTNRIHDSQQCDFSVGGIKHLKLDAKIIQSHSLHLRLKPSTISHLFENKNKTNKQRQQK